MNTTLNIEQGSEKDRVLIPASAIPSYRVWKARERGVHRNFLITTWGGLGDQVCAEPVIRYALKTFNKCDISLYSEAPELFEHLKFKNVFRVGDKDNKPNMEDYIHFTSIQNPDTLLWEFASHMITHCVDFVSICMFRCQLPNAQKEINLPDYPNTVDYDVNNSVVVHAGKHWQSKTFPKQWWDDVIGELKKRSFDIILIGKDGSTTAENTGYVDVDSSGCIDTRDKLNLKQLVGLLKSSKYVLTNDSSPIHIAASGDAFIGFVASCKHPDYIMHWRKGQWAYKMKNFGLDGAWNYWDNNPAQSDTGAEISVEKLPEGVLEKILPDPRAVASHYEFLRGEK